MTCAYRYANINAVAKREVPAPIQLPVRGPVDEQLGQWGNLLRDLREAHGRDGELRLSDEQPVMTQQDLGELLMPPVNQSTVARWERGQMEPRRHYKAQLARILHDTGGQLFRVRVAS